MQSITIVDELPPGLEFVGGSLNCSGGSGSCSYDGPTRTVSCSGVSGNCLVVWDRQEPSPSSDFDVWARLLDSTGQPLGPEFAIAQGSGSQHRPHLVYNSALDEFLVLYWDMWHDGLMDVSAQRVQASNGALLSWANVATGTDDNRRDLRAAHLSERDQYLLVYEFLSAATGYEIHAKIAPGNLSGVSVALFTITASSETDELPAVAAGGDQYLVAWLHTENTLGASGIRARAVSGGGSSATGSKSVTHPAGVAPSPETTGKTQP